MKDFLKTKSFKILIAVLLITIGVIIISVKEKGFKPAAILDFITTPIQKVATKLTQSAADIFSNGGSNSDDKEKIKSLENEVRYLRNQVIDYQNIKQQNEQYEKYKALEAKDASIKFSPASVIGRNPNENFYSITINQGSIAGIKENDAVITENGLIGWIYSVNPSSSVVKTILSPDTKIGAIDKISRDVGVISGNIKLADQNLTRLNFVSAQNNIQPDEIIVSSGLGGIYPRDLPIGKVKEVKIDEYDSSYYAILEPVEDIRKIRDLFVIKEFSGQGKVSMKSIQDIFSEGSKESPEAKNENKK